MPLDYYGACLLLKESEADVERAYLWPRTTPYRAEYIASYELRRDFLKKVVARLAPKAVPSHPDAIASEPGRNARLLAQSDPAFGRKKEYAVAVAENGRPVR